MACKLLIFSKEFYPYTSGSGINAKYFAEYLVRNGHHVSILTLNYYLRLTYKEVINGVSVIRVPMLMMNKYFVRIVAPFLVFPFYLRSIFLCSHIMIYGPLTGYFGVILLGRLLSKKVIFQSVLLDGDDVDTILKKYWYANWFVKKAFSLLTIYHAITPEFANRFENAVGHGNASIRCIPQGVDTDIFRPVSIEQKLALRTKLNLPVTKTIVLSVGNVIERKGYRQIFEELYKRTDDYLYIIIGNYTNSREHFFWHDGTEMKALLEFGNSLLGEKVHFLGLQNNVNEYMQASDLFIHNGLQEGYPNVLLEAKACGIEIISRDYYMRSDHISPVVDQKTQVLNSLNGINSNLIENCDFETVSRLLCLKG